MKKIIIANWGGSNEGKSTTIKLLFNLLREEFPSAILEPEIIDLTYDITVVMKIDGLRIGIESQGDPKSYLLKSLEYFASINCDLIICSTRNRGSTVNAVNALKIQGYQVIWTTNMRSNEFNHDRLNHISARQIFDFIKTSIDPIEYPDISKIVYKYRSWKDLKHRNILLNNIIYFTSPEKFNDPFDCRIVENYNLIEDNEVEEWLKDKVLFHSGKTFPESECDTKYEELKAEFANRDKFQAKKNIKQYEQQNKHYGIISLSFRWNSILMWSHYGDNHKGFCIGFNEEKLRNHLGARKHLVRGGQVSYSGYPKLKPPATFDADYALSLAFEVTMSKSREWSYEDEYRIIKTLYPEDLADNDRAVTFPNECFQEVILGIGISDADKTQIMDVCSKKNIPVFQAKQVPFHFKVIREQIL